MGKGSSIRPYNKAKFDKNWDRIFKVRKGSRVLASMVNSALEPYNTTPKEKVSQPVPAAEAAAPAPAPPPPPPPAAPPPPPLPTSSPRSSYAQWWWCWWRRWWRLARGCYAGEWAGGAGGGGGRWAERHWRHGLRHWSVARGLGPATVSALCLLTPHNTPQAHCDVSRI